MDADGDGAVDLQEFEAKYNDGRDKKSKATSTNSRKAKQSSPAKAAAKPDAAESRESRWSEKNTYKKPEKAETSNVPDYVKEAAAANFNKIDVNGDGEATASEFKKFFKSMAQSIAKPGPETR